MKSINLLLLLIAFCFYTSNGQESLKNYQKIKNTYFIENKGQWHDEVKYYVKMKGMDAWLTSTGIVYDFYIIEDKRPEEIRTKENHDKILKKYEIAPVETFLKRKGHVVRMEYEGMNKNCRFEPKVKSETYHNYFIGQDSSKWASYVGLYKEVIVKDVYPGIDVRWYLGDEKLTMKGEKSDESKPDSQSLIPDDKANPNFRSGKADEGLRYDFIVHPGADVSQIRMKFEGQDGLEINSRGELVIKTSIGNVFHGNIFCYQEIGDTFEKIECSFIMNDNLIGFLGSNYTKKKN